MSKSADYHAGRLIDSAQEAEVILAEGVDKIEEFDDIRKSMRRNMLGLLSVESLQTQGRLLVYIPKLAVKGLRRVARGIYHQRKYSSMTGVDFFDAFPDAMDRLEK